MVEGILPKFLFTLHTQYQVTEANFILATVLREGDLDQRNPRDKHKNLGI